MTLGAEVATTNNPAITTFGMPEPATVQNGYDYNSAIQRRSQDIDLIGQGANDYSKQLADRRVQLQASQRVAGAIAQAAKVQAAATAAATAAANKRWQSSQPANQPRQPTGQSTMGKNFTPGVANQMSIIDKMFPGVKANSGYRPGGTSWHAMGRAVDLPPTMAIYNWIKANYPNSRELIFGPGGNNQIKDGKIVPASFYGNSTMSQHYNHIHWAY